MRIDLQQAVVALSDALDLVGIDVLYHGKRVGYMMLAGYSQLEPELSENQVFQLGLLHDVGVSSTQVHRHLISELEWSGAKEHCLVGAKRLSRFLPLEPLAPYVLYHHSRWEELIEEDVSEKTASLANWIFLTDRVDTLAAGHYQSNILDAKQSIIQTITKYEGNLFKPELVKLFLQLSKSDAFWLSQEQSHIADFVSSRSQSENLVVLDLDELKELASIFAEIVDCKSRFTHQHSQGVARLSRYLAAHFGLGEEICNKIEIAGLLHDLGKLQTPDEVLDKAGTLNEPERHRINHHSFETFAMLKKIVGFEDISRWASYHHESLDGSGYPFQMKSDQLDLEARIVAVADVFQALAQERPYRQGLDIVQIDKILLKLAKQHKLDQQVVAYVDQHMDECYAQALHYKPKLVNHS
jgi:HD-GYP domain-containing protein (c-di-GMP phosphodiesterase class II)